MFARRTRLRASGRGDVPKGAAVCGRSGGGLAGEVQAEVAGRTEPAALGDVLYWQDCRLEQSPRLEQSLEGQPAQRRQAGLVEEAPSESSRREVGVGGELGSR